MRAVVLFLLFACACVAAPASAVCGDGKVSGSETCDVAGATDPACISCRVTPGYECRNPYGSASTCYIKHGDGIVTVSTDAKYVAQSEECDDGNAVAKDGCNPTGKLEAGYYCDASVAAAPASPKVACGQSGTATKPHPFCGDGVVAWPETCDLGGGLAQWPYGTGTDWVNEGNWGCWQCNLVKGWLCDSSYSNGDTATANNNICASARATSSWDTTRPCCARNCGDGLVAGGERCDDGEFPLATWQNDNDECPGCRYPSEDTTHNYGSFRWWGNTGTWMTIANRLLNGAYRGTAPQNPTAGPYWSCSQERAVNLGQPTMTSRYDNLAYVTSAGQVLTDCTCQSSTSAPAGECDFSGSQIGYSPPGGFTYRVCSDLSNEFMCGSCTNHCSAPTYSNGCGNTCCSWGCGAFGDQCCGWDSTSCEPSFTSCTNGGCVYAPSCPSTRCGSAVTCTA